MSVPLEVRVEVEPSPYSVLIGEGLLAEAGARVRAVTPACRAAILTDTNVEALYLDTVTRSFAAAGFSTLDVVIPAGEASKSWAAAGNALESLSSAGLDRTDIVVGLGGGVVGDLSGFVAGTFLRGVDFVQLPTTLLAQVDSSVGGKTGVDLVSGKNLAGVFKQPLVVLADTGTLESLPDSEWQSGLAEVAKVAVLEGEAELAWLERSAERIAGRDYAMTRQAIRRSVDFKARIVAADEREQGLRESLNYGHTFGHALENVAGYGVVPHGLAVAEGIRFAARLAVDAVGASADFARRQVRLLDELGISRVGGSFSSRELRHAMSSDKKARGGSPRFVLAEAPGTWRVLEVPEDVLARHVDEFAAELASRMSTGKGTP